MRQNLLDLYPSELSGGMKKRVAFARAIASDPSIIFLDEPTAGLDPVMVHRINDLILKIQDELGATIIAINPDVDSALSIATNVSMLYQGQILWMGAKEDVKNTSNPYL